MSKGESRDDEAGAGELAGRDEMDDDPDWDAEDRSVGEASDADGEGGGASTRESTSTSKSPR